MAFEIFLETIFYMATDEFVEIVDKFIEDNEDSEDEYLQKAVSILKDFNFSSMDNWYYNTNFLDNDIMITVTKEVQDVLYEYLEDKIDKINDNIGFTYIQINVE